MKIYLGTDHAGFALKETMKSFLQEQGHDVEDCGAYAFDKDDDYPDFIVPAAQAVARTPESKGIVFGGSGQGEAIVANKILGIRAVVFYGTKEAQGATDIENAAATDAFEMIRLTRVHNDANILSLAARFVSEEEARKAVKLWLETPFSNEQRHSRRIDKIARIEEAVNE